MFAGRPCYRCLVPEIPPEAETCARVGVIGALGGRDGRDGGPGGGQADRGRGRPLTGRLLIYDALSAEVRVATVAPDPACAVCGQG